MSIKMGHVECAILLCLNKLMPSSDNPNFKFSKLQQTLEISHLYVPMLVNPQWTA
jgi:hypothetical protein